MENILKLKFCVWGTGRYGNVFLKKMEEYASVYLDVFNQDIMDHILYFVDSSVEKQKLKLCGKAIVSPDLFLDDTKKFCVIAISSRKEVFDRLGQQGFRMGTDYVPYERFLQEFKQEILRQREYILEKYGLDLSQKKEDEFKDLLETVKESFQKLLRDGTNPDRILKYIIFSLVVDKWNRSPDKAGDFAQIREYFDDSFIVAAYAWYFEFHIHDISECFHAGTVMDLPQQRTMPAIGIMVRDYFGGGIEKTVSLLIPLFAKNGHRVVLITDSYMPEREYDLPHGVERHVMSNKMGDNKEERLEELKRCVEEHKIDIMCFHSGYMEVATFYEMWYLKLSGIPVLMELHSAFFPIIMTKKEVSRYYPDMYRMADRIIVLSNTDRVFWESLGCRCKYIPNPLEVHDGKIKYCYNGKGTKTIVWVGRLVQNPKRVLDIIPIMQRVAEKIPDAKLKVVGLATEPLIYRSLTERIAEYQLGNNIELCGYSKDIRSVYQDADAVLMTSESESFCNIITESKLNGKPIVMYELPWLELLKDGRGFIAVKQKDTAAAADAIVTILSDDEVRKKLSDDSHESIQPFIMHDVYRDWKTVFDEIFGLRAEKADGESGENESSGFAASSIFSIIEKKLMSAIYEDTNG